MKYPNYDLFLKGLSWPSPQSVNYILQSLKILQLFSIQWATGRGGEDCLKRKIADISYMFSTCQAQF